MEAPLTSQGSVTSVETPTGVSLSGEIVGVKIASTGAGAGEETTTSIKGGIAVVGVRLANAGTTICGIVYAIHRHPKHWPNPEVFDPNRFLPAEIARRNPNAYLPFSVGRYCVGYKYAMLQMKVTLSTLLRRYKVLPGDRCRCVQDIRTEFGMTLRSLPGNDVRFEPRCPK
ncbi:hypothetical protein M8J76_004162 [Diaphorina citri]|nr:hypothetical protein M8J76_004162 [Diaphorina citri]